MTNSPLNVNSNPTSQIEICTITQSFIGLCNTHAISHLYHQSIIDDAQGASPMWRRGTLGLWRTIDPLTKPDFPCQSQQETSYRCFGIRAEPPLFRSQVTLLAILFTNYRYVAFMTLTGCQNACLSLPPSRITHRSYLFCAFVHSFN